MLESRTQATSLVRDRLVELGVPHESIEAVLKLFEGQSDDPRTNTHAGGNGANSNSRTIRMRKFVDVEVPEIPEGYIRFMDAAKRYNILSGTLSGWVKRDLVASIRISRKHLYVKGDDVRRRSEINSRR